MTRFSLALGVGLLSLTLLPASFLRAQQPQLDALANVLVGKIQKSDGHLLQKRIVVIDFPLQPGEINALGTYLADQLSGALLRQVGRFEVVDRKELHACLHANLLSPRDLQDVKRALWAAERIGANLAVLGFVIPSEEKITLRVGLLRTSDAKELTAAEVSLPLDDMLKDLLTKPLPWPSSAGAAPSPDGLAVSCEEVGEGKAIGAFEAAHVTLPRCIDCPNPEFTEDARKNKAQGSVTLNVVIGADGRSLSIYLVKGAPYGFNEKAIDAVRTWRFKPAMKDGKPVPVCVAVDITWRLF